MLKIISQTPSWICLVGGLKPDLRDCLAVQKQASTFDVHLHLCLLSGSQKIGFKN
jgi:hypothetical protein